MSKKGKLTPIGIAAKKAGISRQSLQYYLMVGLLEPTEVTPAGRRLFDERTIERIRLIKNLNQSIDKINNELKQRGQRLKGHENLTSIKGISDIGATIFLNTIGNIADFKSEKHLAAYFGIVPRVYISNKTVQYGRITKMGNKIARTTLVQSTLVAIRYSPYLRKFYDRLKAKKGSGKAIIATSRKMLGIIYNTLKNNWVFEDFTRFKLVGCA